MTFVETSPTTTVLEEAVRLKLQNAVGPLKLADVAKGLPKAKKTKAADFQSEVQAILDEYVRLGMAFRHPSGKANAERFWHKDEKHLLREKAVEIAARPRTLTQMTKVLGKEVKGVDKAFVESVVRELIGDDQLFEHPPVKKAGSPLFGSARPPRALPPLEQPKNKVALDKLVVAAEKILTAAQVSLEDLVNVIRERLSSTRANMAPPSQESKPSREQMHTDFAELENIILKEVGNNPVVSLLDMRANLPLEFRGQMFDDTVIRLANDQRIMVYQDAEPASFSEAERAGYVKDGVHFYTTIAKRG